MPDLLKIYLLFAVMMISPVVSSVMHAQGNHDKKLKMGNQAYQQGDLYKAIEYYTAYCEGEGDNYRAFYKLAESLRKARDYERAFYYYGKAREIKNKLPLSYFYQGKMGMSLGNYDTAMVFFKKFRSATRGKRKYKDFRRMAYDLVKGCELALTDTLVDRDYEIIHAGNSVNREHLEFTPHPIHDSLLLFTSIQEKDQNTPSSIDYRVALKKKNNWVILEDTLTSFMERFPGHGIGDFSGDMSRYYFSAREENWQGKVIYNIYLSEKKDGIWQPPVMLGYNVNHPDYSSMMVTVTSDLRTGKDVIYFVSDREGGKGGMDIWYTYWNSRENEFREPRNAGLKINTEGDEITPWYDSDSRGLWFASDGHPNYGGFDIFKASGSMRKWIEVEHMPRSMNTSFDEYYPAVVNQGTEGYFTSNRDASLNLSNGHCCDDIFYFRRLGCFFIPVTGSVYNIPGYDIHDFLTSKFQGDFSALLDTGSLSDIPVQLFLDEDKEEILLKTIYTSKAGTFNFVLEKGKDYFILIKNYGYFDKRLPLKTAEMECGDTIGLRSVGINYIPELTMRFNIYYEFDKAKLNKQARVKIDTTLLDVFDVFPNAIVEIGSHTDNMGSDNYNRKLSQKRSESVVKYLIEQGIPENRLVAKGYGESKPVAPNTLEDGTDNPEGRQLNRRTEIKIVGQTNTFYDEY
jgi:outer membrane protein OmpA-like peptidoglycan-associated protein/tetratricopeptide (TPR) repeat protein